MNKKIIFGLIFLLSFCFIVSAQNINNVNVNSLGEAQIQQVVKEVESRGLSLDQAVTLAKARGATTIQINDIMRRIQELRSGNQQLLVSPGVETAQSSALVRGAFSKKANLEATAKNKRVFGYYLFNNENLTFEPSVNIPTPKNYVIGSGDEININVWGASQQSYQLDVDQSGSIHVKDLGPIYLSGMNFENAEKLIKKRFTAIYAGMAGDKPNTWAEVSLGSLRSIKINIIGEVNVPGTYNLPSTATAFNALYLSGGPNENGSFRNIKLIRDGKTIQVLDIYDFLINGNTKHNYQLRDQDILFIPIYEKKVEVIGAFKRNGYFELIEKESLADLIRYAGNFSGNAYKHRLSITKYTDKDMMMADVEQKDFSNYIPDNSDIIKAGVVINRFSNRVKIAGAIYRPGSYELKPQLTLSQLIKKAEGVKDEVYSSRGIIIREKEDRTTQLISFDVNDVLSGKMDIVLMREDSIEIKDVFSMREVRVVQLIGEVQQEGEFDYHEGMTVKDLLFFAGGLKEAASESLIEISRRHNYNEAATESDDMVKVFSFNINRDLSLSSSDEIFQLLPFDQVYVRSAPSYFTQQTVQVKGEIMYPGSYSIKSKNERVSNVLKRAGGFTKFAHIEGATLERSYRIRGMNLVNLNILSDSLTVDSSIREMQANLLELNLVKILQNPGSVYDYKLKDGDIIHIPVSTLEIRVVGEVMSPIGMAYEKRRSLKYYIDKTGGFTTNAKRSKIYVLYANGTTKTTKQTLFLKDYPPIKPGCQIIIPPKPVRTANSSQWVAFASVLASLTLTFATIFK